MPAYVSAAALSCWYWRQLVEGEGACFWQSAAHGATWQQRFPWWFVCWCAAVVVLVLVVGAGLLLGVTGASLMQPCGTSVQLVVGLVVQWWCWKQTRTPCAAAAAKHEWRVAVHRGSCSSQGLVALAPACNEEVEGLVHVRGCRCCCWHLVEVCLMCVGVGRRRNKRTAGNTR